MPYLGIVFCPGAVCSELLVSSGTYRSQSMSSDSERTVCYASTIVGLVVLAVQVLLWWILYQAPNVGESIVIRFGS